MRDDNLIEESSMGLEDKTSLPAHREDVLEVALPTTVVPGTGNAAS
eukprot:CAMPEP_0119038042 /NCGR_PEP_ID=MMETSP1177-20130426/6699_1 /TAXON_ID=2985 /ORGANISM="Ochromonas sp, Strain CCMP1899" /LENGTH=45 /DNA_ID= /DNA_START= /DNA_END= /DNA_ORIENTATION=